MPKRFMDVFIAIVLGAAVTLTTTAQPPARQGGAATPAQAGAPAARTVRGGVLVVDADEKQTRGRRGPSCPSALARLQHR